MEHPRGYFAWESTKTEMSLTYSKDRHKGILEIWSKRISEERRTYEKQKEKERIKEKGF